MWEKKRIIKNQKEGWDQRNIFKGGKEKDRKKKFKFKIINIVHFCVSDIFFLFLCSILSVLQCWRGTFYLIKNDDYMFLVLENYLSASSSHILYLNIFYWILLSFCKFPSIKPDSYKI